VETEKDGVGDVDGLDYASFAVVSPDGLHVYVAGFDDSAIAGFRRDETTGALSFTDLRRDGDGGIDGLWGARCIAISPDGRHVYVAGYHDDGVAIFNRIPATGNLNFSGRVKDSDWYVDGLDGATYVAISPDGTNVYAAGHNDNAVVVFGRDASNGALTFLEMVQDGVDGVDGLWGAQGVTVSPDGRHVYATGFFDRAVAVFSRAPTTGRLTFVEVEQHVDILDGAQSLAVSPDGRYVYVTGYVDDAMTVFGRDAGSGALTYLETHRDGNGEVDGLDGTSAVAVSSDGRNVYVTGFNDNAVAVFSGQSGVYLPLIIKN
jgi:6-phosphogluconolactonase (cycloisomerase 2 family)